MSKFNIVSGKHIAGLLLIFFSHLSFSFWVKAEDRLATLSLPLKQDTLVLARVSTNPSEHYKYLKPVADYLVANLKDLGIKKAKVLFANDNQQMIRFIKQGKVDLITETTFSAALFNEKVGAEILLRRWKKGVPEYSSVIFSRKDSGIDSFEDLPGKVIAFQDRGSSSAFFIPASILIRDGYELYKLDSPRELPPQDKIGFVFANKEINISTWVHKGIVEAGAFSNLDWNNEEDMPSEYRKDLSINYESHPFPRGIELVRSDLHPVLKARIKEILMTAHENEAGRKALAAYQKTKKYDELDEKSSEGVKIANELRHIVENQL
ncbi:phosphate/phosphite/phosphonate ABC transporter substrate-binding protein [Photobacterium sp. SDRW27]|uniref:phosphate/phosphite/phosphonate ABC transporter substrate-binding protein n=1 Tax=Photobacterium obscurum TaxID=2829490 RepID=UPI002243DE1B|nr:phosphate/phosphite/phosphonate ABC transporter substrate-binding protein [Photobacterium obscurum]MCW8329100.1 phosphate/phosphite/phosphonate ABC transporter substrate-binding protein [Photobacterium obscurum]